MPIVLLTVVLALVLAAVVVPAGYVGWQPPWPLLVSIFWLSVTPPRIGLMFVWCVGLLSDVMTVAPLGTLAGGYVLVGWIVYRQRPRFLMSSLLQQAATVFALVLLLHLLHGAASWSLHRPVDWLGFVMSATLSAVVWPLLALPLELLRQWLDGGHQ